MYSTLSSQKKNLIPNDKNIQYTIRDMFASARNIRSQMNNNIYILQKSISHCNGIRVCSVVINLRGKGEKDIIHTSMIPHLIKLIFNEKCLNNLWKQHFHIQSYDQTFRLSFSHSPELYDSFNSTIISPS